MQGDVFGLGRLYELQVKNKEGSQTIQSSSFNYGYFGGGAITNVMSRLDFSNEIVNVISSNITPGGLADLRINKSLSVAKGNLSTAYTTNYGYFYGGIVSSPPSIYTTSIDRFHFATETTSLIPSKLTLDRGYSGTIFNQNYGYICGGTGTTLAYCTIDRMEFSTDTISSPGKNLPTTKYHFSGAISPTTNYGYLSCGLFPTDVCTISRLDLTTETAASLGKSMAPARWGATSSYNNEYGYWGGGYFNAPPTFVQVYYSTISRVEFSTETVSNPPTANFVQSRYRGASAVQNSTNGYFGGGQTTPTTLTCRIERLNFSTETVAVPGNNLVFAFQGLGGLSYTSSFNRTRNYFNENSLYGYFSGGDVPTRTTNVDRLDYSNETVSSPGKYFTVAKEMYASAASSSYGYLCGGRSSPNVLPATILINSAIDRIDLVSETTSSSFAVVTRFRAGFSGTSNSSYGYFGGGYVPTPAFFSTIDRIEFSNETVTVPGRNLLQSRYFLSAISSENYAYYGGGRLPTATNFCIIDRLDFSTETVSLPGNNLRGLRHGHASASSNTYGYFGGGYSVVTPATRTCTIDRVDLSTETVDTLLGTFSTANSYSGSTSTLSYGYWAGGGTPLATSTTSFQRLDFYTNVTSSPTGTLSSTRRFFDGFSGGISKVRRLPTEFTTQYGYYGGGYNTVAPIRRSVISRLDLTTEVSTTIPQTLSSDRSNMSSMSNNIYGYYLGGFNPTPAQVCTINRLDFSSEVVSTPTNQLLTARGGNVSVSSVYNYGYTTSGSNVTPTNICTIERIDFDTEVSNTLTATTSATGQYASSITTSLGGIIFGGQFTPTTFSCRIERISYSSETISVYTAGLPAERYNTAVTGNTMFGYLGGGNVPVGAITNTINRIDLITDTAISSPANLLKQTRRGNVGTSNWAYGYYAGGSTPPNIFLSNIDRLDFTTETVRTSANFMSSSLDFPTALTAAPKKIVGTSPTFASYGYFAGGTVDLPVSGAFSCSVERIDFSNETMSVTTSLPQVRDRSSSASNSNYGYFGGGRNAPTTHVSTIDRLEYSTNTYSNPGKNLTLGRSNLSSAENTNYAYFGGGYMQVAPFSRCLIDRLDFSNETVLLPTVIPGQLFFGVNSLTAVSSKNYGYFAGGISPLNSGPAAPGDRVTTVNRLDFSTEVTSLPGNNLNDVGTLGKQGFCATQNSNYGFFAGGVNPGGGTPVQVSTFNRLDFSTETLSVPSKFLTSAKSSFDGVSSTNYGYYAAGSTTIRTCVIDRLDFSTETVVSPGTYFISTAKSAISGLQNG